ncbi:MAG TPA: LacI family DNA-binding transcriptional regulator [Chthonomonadaceae bacterium]|nr:LacI family DNA-binding transcriptional regulator [Chthonomonadaceae bacterium]
MATIKDVAKLAGVDASTVSLALNANPRISAATRLRVEEAARQLNYQKNYLARGLRARQSATIGVVISGWSSAFWGEIMTGIENTVRSRDYHMMVTFSGGDVQAEHKHIEALLGKQVDGLIIAPVPQPPHARAYQMLQARPVPFVFIDRYVPEVPADLVCTDNVEAGRRVAEHLWTLGHRQAVYCHNASERATSTEERFEGILQVFAPERVTRVGLTSEDRAHLWDQFYAGMQAVVPFSSDVTAVIAGNDMIGVATLRALQDCGLRIPDDVSVTGFDDLDIARMTNPPLTTVAQAKEEIGATATRLLLDRIASRGTDAPCQVRLSASLIVRRSTGAAAQAPL